MKTTKKIFVLPIMFFALVLSFVFNASKNVSAVGFESYQNDASNWQVLYNAEIDEGYLKQTNTQSLAISKDFSGSSSVKFTLDYTKLDGSWGGVALMLKGDMETFAETLWTFDHTNLTLVPTQMKGSFLALTITHGGYQLLVCDHGDVSVIGDNTTYLLQDLNGFGFWYLCDQKTEVTITTRDVENGVDVSISYKASGNPSNQAKTYTWQGVIEHKELWGKQCAGILYGAGINNPNKNNNKVSFEVYELSDEYNKDLYAVSRFKDELAKISYETIDDENYPTILDAYNKAKEEYDALNETQTSLVSEDDLNKFKKVENDLSLLNVVTFTNMALNKLPIDPSFNRDNYDDYKALIIDAETKYNSLLEEEKASISADLLALLKKDKEILEAYEDILKYADPVVELINKITLPFEVFAIEYKNVKAAKKAYDELFEDEQKEVYNYSVLENAIKEVNDYLANNKEDGYNFISSKENLYELNGYDEMSVVDDELVVNTSETNLSIYPYIDATNEKEVTYILDANLDSCSWGNLYFIFKADGAKRRHNKGSWLAEGNYAILLIGGDGFKVSECINGEIPMTVDAANNPIADFQTVLDYPTNEEGLQGDIHFIYKYYTVLKIKTINLYENDKYIGYKAIFTLTGGLSGKTFVREYISTNTNTENLNSFGLEMYVSNPINDGQGGFAVSGLYVEGVDSFDVKQVKKEIADKEAIAKFESAYKNLIIDVDENNITEAKVALENANKAYKGLSNEAIASITLDISILETIQNSLSSVEKEMANNALVKEIITSINNINKDVNKDNLSEVKTAYEKAKASYDELDETLKIKITNAEDLDVISEAIQRVEKKVNGCSGEMLGSSLSMLALLGLMSFLKRRKS